MVAELTFNGEISSHAEMCLAKNHSKDRFPDASSVLKNKISNTKDLEKIDF